MTEDVQTQDAKPAETAPVQTDAQPAKTDHPGREYVDTSQLPPEVREKVEARIRYLAGKSKWTENALRDLAAQNQRLEDAVNKIAQDKADETTGQTVTRLEQQKVEAFQRADFEGVTKIDSELIKLRVTPAEPVRAVESPSGLSPSEVATIDHWSREVGESGQFKRPWAIKGHPQYDNALRAVQQLATDQRFISAPIESILQEVERRMTPQRQQQKPTAAAVLNGNGAIRPHAKQEIALSSQEERVAINMFKRSGLAKTDQEAIERYRKQKQLMAGQR